MTCSYKATHTQKNLHLQIKNPIVKFFLNSQKQNEGEKKKYLPPPSSVVNFSTGKSDTLSSSNLYQSSLSSSIPMGVAKGRAGAPSTAVGAGGLAAWNTLFLTKPI